MILLVTRQESLVETLNSTLPVSVPVTCVASLDEYELWILAQKVPAPLPELILLDTGTGRRAAEACRKLRALEPLQKTPWIALISRAAERRIVLEAGADDYLLLPLLPAELKTRLSYYLHTGIRSFNALAEAIDTLYSGVPSAHLLNEGIEQIARMFNASSAWLLVLRPGERQVDLIGSYNLPPLLAQNQKTLADETIGCINLLKQAVAGNNFLPQLIQCPYLAAATTQATGGLTHHLSIPLRKKSCVIGVLNLAYPGPCSISRVEQEMLALLGRDIGILLDLHHLHQETQLHATQTAFILLLARMLNERLDLSLVLSFTLEQGVALLNATRGEIWLMSKDRQRLELASALTPFATSLLPDTGDSTAICRPLHQGLMGRVAEKGVILRTTTPAAEAGFDPQLDEFQGKTRYALLALPLRHHEQTIGVMALYNPPSAPFEPHDETLLEGVAGLTATALANARLVQELRSYGEQHRVLYEMSQQIAAGLDLPSTLQRTLYWTSRLLDTEVGLLWLLNDTGDSLELEATLGLPSQQRLVVLLAESLNGWAIRHNEAIVANDPVQDNRINQQIHRQLGLELRNLLAVPISYYGQAIGTLNLCNKIGGAFNETDRTLITTAAEIIAVAIGNARLHTQTLTLMAERERLHQQVLQTERLATVGRLTASLSHEINNPMQAIQGALALALEELDDPAAVTAYLQMSQRESERVVQLIDRMRQIYRPGGDQSETVSLNELLREAAVIARKELANQRVRLRIELAPDLPPLQVVVNQMHLVFLNLILNLSQAIGRAGGGELLVRSCHSPERVCFEFSTEVPLNARASWARALEPEAWQEQPELSFGVSVTHDIIMAHGGAIGVHGREGQTIFRLELPVDRVEPAPARPHYLPGFKSRTP